ncbi:MAG: hypothetical protein PCFJNLEI_01467 [Verrucomicrobiae bacterium]|nr:hypothetical protein [Verrucomicrobiae bacterium]
MNCFRFTFVLTISAVTFAHADEDAPALSALARMPVREVTVFKDGHAFVSHQGKLPTDAAGNVLMDYLPAPVFGTFWPSSMTKNAKLTAVTAGQRRVTVTRTPLSIRELIEANVGAEVMISETTRYEATILGMTERSAAELEAIAPPNAGEMLPQKGNVVLLKTIEGTKAVNIERIVDVTFKTPPKTGGGNVEFRNLLTLKLDWSGRKPEATAEVGLMYVQRGIRWIPNYKVTIDGAGKATVKLQATLLNELTDLEDVTCHLVIGVPTFQFKDTPDPMALQGALAQLSQYFREADPRTGQYQMLSNALMTQAPRMSEYRASQPAPTDLGPEVTGGEASEDLYMFTVKNVTLKKGQRMVLPVTEFTVPYRDVYTLELPFAPPPEVWRNFNNQQQGELARLLSAPKVMHKIRLENKSEHPFTTAPALIVQNDRVLGQGMMTYTSKGGQSDLPITAAVDIQVKKTDTETKRTPNAVNWDGNSYARIDLTGAVRLTNYGSKPVDLEVTRYVLGNITEAGNDGKIEMVNVFEDSSFAPSGGADYRPYWWSWWNWPYWWSRFNGIGRADWKLTIAAGKSESLNYTWHYFWR